VWVCPHTPKPQTPNPQSPIPNEIIIKLIYFLKLLE